MSLLFVCLEQKETFVKFLSGLVTGTVIRFTGMTGFFRNKRLDLKKKYFDDNAAIHTAFRTTLVVNF